MIYMFRKALAKQLLMFAFHHKNEVCPIKEFGVHFNAGLITGTGRPRMVFRVVFKQPLSSWAAPLVFAANEKEVSHC